MEIVIAIIGILLTIILAFETPRKAMIGFFSKTPDISQDLRVNASFRAHNDGKPLGSLGTNKTDKTYVLTWVVTNNSDRVIQIEPAMLMKQRHNQSVMSLKAPAFTNETQIIQNHKLQLISIELTENEVEHYRHWIKESLAFGIKETSGKEHWLDNKQYLKLESDLNNIAREYGLPDEVPKGKKVMLRVKKDKPSNKSLNTDAQ